MAICAECGLGLTKNEEGDGICYKCSLMTPKMREEAAKQEEEDRKWEEARKKEKLREQEEAAKLLALIITTSDTLHGKGVYESIGLVRGSTVRSKHVGRDIMAEIKTIVGGELKGYTEMLAEAREEAIYRMKMDAMKVGADAIVAFRMSTASVMVEAAEIIAYGTAVRLQR